MDHCDTGVVFCYPCGQEYIRCHKLYLNMANQLAKRGFHALRFDYKGTGDSSGDFCELTINQSLEDIHLVIEQFRQSFDISRIVLFGVRFGATLAIMYSKLAPVDALILWNPILDGSSYIKEINESYRRWLNGSFTKQSKGRNINYMENFGFQFSETFLNEIRGVRNIGKELDGSIPSLIFTEQDLGIDQRHLFTYEKPVSAEYWIKRENEFNKVMVPVYETNKTLAWITNLTS
nr:alpha/beta hydrolase [Fulvivirga imtechensis]